MVAERKIEITKTQLPQSSILQKESSKYHYEDSFEGLSNSKNHIDSAVLAKAFMSSSPKWVESLFNFRNRIVKVFGLKTSDSKLDKEETLKNFNGDIAENIGFFKIYDKSESEVILGEDDKHLDFRVSLLKIESEESGSKIILSTVVQFHNWFGRLYFLPVKPFHKLIVPVMLKGIIKELDKQK